MLFSIIVPVYNMELYLDKCLQSILHQTFADFEVILINDGSQDKSAEICEKYAKIDKRILLIHQENHGLPVTRNIGMGLASAPYLIWVDADDWIDKDLLAEVKKAIDQTAADIIIFDYYIVKNTKYEKHKLQYQEGILDKQEMMASLALDMDTKSYMWDKVCKRSLFEGILFADEHRGMEDYPVMHLLFHKADTFYYLPRQLYYYLHREGSLSRPFSYNAQQEHVKIQITLQRMTFLNENYPEISQAVTLIAPMIHIRKTIIAGDYQDEGLQTVLKLMRKNLWGLFFNKRISWKEKRNIFIIATAPAIYRKYKLIKNLK